MSLLASEKIYEIFLFTPKTTLIHGGGRRVGHSFLCYDNKGHLTPILSVPSRHIGPSQSFSTPLDWLLRSAPPPTTSNLPLTFLSLLYVSKEVFGLRLLLLPSGAQLI